MLEYNISAPGFCFWSTGKHHIWLVVKLNHSHCWIYLWSWWIIKLILTTVHSNHYMYQLGWDIRFDAVKFEHHVFEHHPWRHSNMLKIMLNILHYVPDLTIQSPLPTPLPCHQQVKLGKVLDFHNTTFYGTKFLKVLQCNLVMLEENVHPCLRNKALWGNQVSNEVF